MTPTPTTLSLEALKALGRGIQTGLTEDGLLVIVVDTKKQVGTSKHGNPIFGITPGFTGTPYGEGLFVNLVVGRKLDAQQE